jgi:hypothetical protein
LPLAVNCVFLETRGLSRRNSTVPKTGFLPRIGPNAFPSPLGSAERTDVQSGISSCVCKLHSSQLPTLARKAGGNARLAALLLQWGPNERTECIGPNLGKSPLSSTVEFRREIPLIRDRLYSSCLQPRYYHKYSLEFKAQSSHSNGSYALGYTSDYETSWTWGKQNVAFRDDNYGRHSRNPRIPFGTGRRRSQTCLISSGYPLGSRLYLRAAVHDRRLYFHYPN